MLWFFIILTTTTFLGMCFLFVFVSLRPAPAVAAKTNTPLLWLVVDYFAVHLPVWLKRFFRSLSMFGLAVLRWLLALSRYFISRLERRFARLADTIHGRGGRGQRGSASLFLTEIKQHVDETKTHS